MNRVQKSVLIGFTMVITSIILFTIGNHAFAIEYSNNIYGIESDYPNIVYLDWIKPSIERNDGMIIPVGANFKESNQYKINSCAQSYHKMIPKIYQGDESYWEGSVVACAYGMYNYNINIGDKKSDIFDVQMIEIEASGCMIDDHCMKKIKDILKGKIALPSTPTFKGSSPTISPPQKEIPKKFSPQEEEQQLIDLCAQVLYDKRQSPLCQDLTPDVKQKVQIEAQKLGVSVHKIENSTQNSPSTPNQNQQDKKPPIYSCARNLIDGFERPVCEKLSPDEKIQVQVEVQKLREKNMDTKTEKNSDEDDDEEKDEDDDDDNEDDDDNKKKNKK